MNARHRYIETLTFGVPDKIPFNPGNGRESTLARWHKEGLPADKNPLEYVCDIIGIEHEKTKTPVKLDVNFRMMPQFEEKVLEHKNGHYICQDWKGNVCEISDEFDITYLKKAKDFVTRRWIKCPVDNRDDWEEMKTRYNSDSLERFPEDFAKRCKKAADRDWVLTISIPGPFWQLREWCGFEGLCMMTIEQTELVEEMAEFWMNFVSAMLEKVLQHIVPDCIHICEDMAYKAKAMISPDMVHQFLVPSWTKWSSQVRNAGCPIVDIDSDGYIGELIPIWIESGVNVCDPIEVAAHCDINIFRQEFGHKMAYSGGVDKRCIAQGGQIIKDEIKRIEPVVKDGGFIPSCDHGIPADVSWPNMVEYVKQLAQITGWL